MREWIVVLQLICPPKKRDTSPLWRESINDYSHICTWLGSSSLTGTSSFGLRLNRSTGSSPSKVMVQCVWLDDIYNWVVDMSDDLDSSQIRNWRSIVTLVVFVLTSKQERPALVLFRNPNTFDLDMPILFPFHLPVYIPRLLSNATLDTLSALRVMSPRQDSAYHDFGDDLKSRVNKPFVRLDFPMNFITAPLIADLFLLAISAIGRQEVHDGTIGNNNNGISPLDVILVFLCLGYIANSIEASGLIRYLVFKVLQRAGAFGHRLFLYLYTCFFCLGIFIGNDPIMLLFLFLHDPSIGQY